jgi:Reverse transcriptase (RNA-dependent DNA polymerase)
VTSFDEIDHQVMLSTLGAKIHDGRFLRLLSHMLKAGYLQDWRWHATLSGAPQGGVASPILSNIYLDRLDQFVEQQLLPAHNHGKRRRRNPTYRAVDAAIQRAQTARRPGGGATTQPAAPIARIVWVLARQGAARPQARSRADQIEDPGVPA